MTEATRKLICAAVANIHDLLATILGIILSALIMYEVNYEKLLAFDRSEVAKFVAAFVVAAHGYVTNKKRKADPHDE